MTPQISLDFSSTNSAGLVYTRTSLASAPVEVGTDVLAIDEDGNTCMMRVMEIKGGTAYLRPDWDTWQDGPVTAVQAMLGGYRDYDAEKADGTAGDTEPSPASGTNLVPEPALA